MSVTHKQGVQAPSLWNLRQQSLGTPEEKDAPNSGEFLAQYPWPSWLLSLSIYWSHSSSKPTHHPSTVMKTVKPDSACSDPPRTCSQSTWTLKKSFVESHFLLLIHTVMSQRTRKAEEIPDCQDKRLLPSLDQGLALIYWASSVRPAPANTILKTSLETEKVSQQFPALTQAFFPAHIISAELSMQLDEVNQQSGISKVFIIRSQVYCHLD